MAASGESASCPKYKIVLVGDSTVGKTSLLNAFLRQTAPHGSTIGATCTRVISTIDDCHAELHIWANRNLVPIYARGSNVAILVFDQTNPEWHSFMLEKVGQIPATVNIELANGWARGNGLQMIRTSAMTGLNVDRLFQGIIESLAKSARESDTPKSVLIEKSDQTPRTGCCS
jgi:GTPase SAR1 family protein